jgi:hypothetical protein
LLGFFFSRVNSKVNSLRPVLSPSCLNLRLIECSHCIFSWTGIPTLGYDRCYSHRISTNQKKLTHFDRGICVSQSDQHHTRSTESRVSSVLSCFRIIAFIDFRSNNFFLPLYSISFMWYAFNGVVVTVVIGLACSLVCGAYRGRVGQLLIFH